MTDTLNLSHDDPRSTEELIAVALTASEEDIPENDNEIHSPGWEAIWVLRYRATREVFDTVQVLCISPIAHERRVGVDILGQLGIPKRAFPDQSLEILLKLLDDGSIEVLESVCVALGHLHDPRSIEALIKFKDHPDAQIRFSIAFALSGFDDDQAIKALIELTTDQDDQVRDWATFGLGALIEVDTKEIREALYNRLADSYDDAVGEAMVGLARRKDERAISPLLETLASDNVGSLPLEAAEEFADPRLYPALLELKARRTDPKDWCRRLLEDAITACTPKTSVS